MSNGDKITPLGMQRPLMTDRNWNNSELKNFSVQNSKSNADILDEIRRYRDPNDREQADDHIKKVNMQHNAMQTKTPDQDTEEDVNTIEGGLPGSKTPTPHDLMKDVQPHSGTKKGKTLTVLFKADKQSEVRQTNVSSRLD